MHGSRVQGLEFVILCLRPGQAKQYSGQNAFVGTVEASLILDAYGKHDMSRQALAAFATDFERTAGTSIIDVLQTDRHLGRNYSYTGRRHPLSPLAARANYWDSVALIKQLYEFYLDQFDRHEIGTVLLGGVASLPLKLLCVAAKTAGLDVRVIATARVGNRLIWARDEFLSIPQLAEAWQRHGSTMAVRANSGNEAESRPDALYGYAATVRSQARFSRRFTIAGLLTAVLGDLALSSLQGARRMLKATRKKAGRYYLGSRLRNHLNAYSDYRVLHRCCDPAWKRPQDTPYVFLPLHVEPEASLAVLSPEFNTQLGMIDLIAKALPAGVTLVVKEHRAAIGRRPEGFYDWLQNIPAVVLAPLEASGPTLARNSRVTVTITGTAGFEAAVAGVPVITFGEHNFYNCLPHVHVLRDLRTLRTLLHAVTRSDQDRKQLCYDGKRFFDCLLAVSIDLGHETLSPRLAPSQQAIEKLFDGFWSTLDRRG